MTRARTIQLSILGALLGLAITALSAGQARASILAVGNINTCGELAAPGTYNLTASVATSSGACFTITSNSVVITSSNSYTVTGGISGNGVNAGDPGFDFTVENLTVTGAISANGADFGSSTGLAGYAGNAGSITIASSTVGTVTADGGVNYNWNNTDYGGNGGTVTISTSTFSSASADGGGYVNTSLNSGMNGGNGGTVTISGSSLALSGLSISASGGTGGDQGSNGTDGTLALDYTVSLAHSGLVLSSLSSVALNGSSTGSFGAGVLGAFPWESISSASQCDLGFAGTYTISGNISGDCVITNSSVTLDGTGHTITGDVIGDGSSTVPGYVYAGRNFTLKDALVTGTTSSNGISSWGIDGSGGGTITLFNATTSGISANGGNNGNNNGGNGGTVIVYASSTDLVGVGLSLTGGTHGTAGSNGSAGNLTAYYATFNHSGLYLPKLTDLKLYGPGNSPGDTGSFAGGTIYAIPGDSITSASQCTLNITGSYSLGSGFTGDCNIQASGVTLDGGSHTITGDVVGDNASGNGYSYTLKNITVTGTSSSNAIGTTVVGAGGTITIGTSTIGAVTANGSVNAVSSSASVNGGTVTISTSTVAIIQANAGSDSGSSVGYGGHVTLKNSTSTSIQANGAAGGGGVIAITKTAMDLSGMTISATGGGGSPVLGTLTLNYSSIVFSSTTFSGLSDWKFYGPSSAPGDLGAFAGGTISAPAPGGTISNISQCFLVSPGTYSLGADMTGSCLIRSNSVVVNGGGHTITGTVSGDSPLSGGNGFGFTLNDMTVTGTTSSNGSANSGGGGGNGGAITISTSTVGALTSNGGGNSSAGNQGGNGGSLTITNSTTTVIQSNGGTGLLNGSGGSISVKKTSLDLTGMNISAAAGTGGFSGSNGTLIIGYTSLNFAPTTSVPALADLQLNGPGNLPGDLGAWAGGVLGIAPGGTITSAANCDLLAVGTYYLGNDITGDCRINMSAVTLDGQGHTIHGKVNGNGEYIGNSFTLKDITVTGTTSADDINTIGSGDQGGSITAIGSTLATTTANVNAGGVGGTITMSSSTATAIQVNGGANLWGGAGGSIIITNNAIDLASTAFSTSWTGAQTGSITLNYTTLNTSGSDLPALSDLVLNGPGGQPGDLGAWPGGPLVLPGGDITSASQCNLQAAGTYTLGNDITGTCYIKSDSVVLDGGGHTITGSVIGDGATNRRGYDFTLQNITVTATTSSNGNGTVGGYGTPGGSITLVNATSTGISANGGALGGSISLTDSYVNLASTTFTASGSVRNGALTLGYTTLNTAGASLPALSDLVLNGPGNSPGDVGPYLGGTFTMQSIGDISQCSSLSSPGVYVLTADLSGNCNVVANGVVIDGAGHTLTGSIIGSGSGSGGAGKTFSVVDLTFAGSGGITAAGSLTGASNGGTVTVKSSSIDLSKLSINLAGHNGGTDGSLTLIYSGLSNYGTSILPALSDLVLNGPGYSPGDIGSFAGGAFTVPGGTISSASQCQLIIPGTYKLGSDMTGDCLIATSSVTIDGGGFSIDGNVSGNGLFPGGKGYSFTLQDMVASGTVSSNGAVNTDGTGGAGGSIAMNNASGTIDLATTTFSASGAAGSAGSGANGSLTLDYSTILNYSGPPGHQLPALSDLVLNGPNDVPGDVGAYAGGYIGTIPGGTITDPTQLAYLNLPGTYTLGGDMTGDVGIFTDGVVINGGGHVLHGNVNGDGSYFVGSTTGSSFTLENVTVTGTTSADGYAGDLLPDYATPGNGGVITVSSSTLATTTSNGSPASKYKGGGHGGTITITDSTTTLVQANGGIGSYYGYIYGNSGWFNSAQAGGAGGTITIDPSVTGAVEANGGDSQVEPAGAGGTISITDSYAVPAGSTVSANGGDSTICGYGGAGGSVNLVNSTYGTVSANAGANQLSGGCNSFNNQSVTASGSYVGGASAFQGGVAGLVQVIGQYIAPGFVPSAFNAPPSVSVPAPQPSIGAPTGSAGSSGSPVGYPVAAPGAGPSASYQAPSYSPSISSFSGTVVRAAVAAIQNTVQAASIVEKSPVTKTVQATGFVAGLVASVISAADSAYAAPLAAEALFAPLRLWGLALMGLGIRRKARPWGTVYDSDTKQPIDPAFVTVKDQSGKVVAESMTDVDGRYGFLLPDGVYYVSAKKTNYEFPSKKMAGRQSDEIYGDLYFGGPVTIKAGQVLDRNIPMDQKDFDWNEQVKKSKGIMSFHSRNEKAWSRASNYIYGFGFAISIIALALHQTVYNFVILALYAGVMIILNSGIARKKLGHVTSGSGTEPLSYGIVRVTAFDHQTLLRSAVCDARGRYYCLVPKGQYYVDIEKKNQDGSYSKIYQSELMSNDSGVLNKDFDVGSAQR